MGENEVLLQKAWEGLNYLLDIGQIDDTYIQLLYFIKNLNEDNNLVIGLSEKEMEELFDEEGTNEPGILSMGEGLFEKLKHLENSMVISIGDIDLGELFKKLNED